jgi:hypothetical protein
MESGVASGHYFHQDLWAAREVYALAPKRLVDVGSRVDGFVAHVLVFRDVEVIDIRQLDSRVRGLSFVRADLIRGAVDLVQPADCVTCLHALEHFGLGRYGDPVDVDGWRRGLASLVQLMEPRGTLLLSVPVGRQRVEFDAQRVFWPRTIIEEAAGHGLGLQRFCFVDDLGQFHSDATPDSAADLEFGCGCFVFTRSVAHPDRMEADD